MTLNCQTLDTARRANRTSKMLSRPNLQFFVNTPRSFGSLAPPDLGFAPSPLRPVAVSPIPPFADTPLRIR
jgi:hypothetical protein